MMRAAGYRSVKSYMFEVRSRHVRAGFVWTGQLDYALGDIKRAATRALGPKLKAEEIRLQWWTALNEALSYKIHLQLIRIPTPLWEVSISGPLPLCFC